MNDRIKELARQAYADTFKDASHAVLVTRDEIEQKFAELLIKEAVNVISVRTNGFSSAEESIWRTKCVQELRNYFGVTYE